jgi:hypothetical protein
MGTDTDQDQAGKEDEDSQTDNSAFEENEENYATTKQLNDLKESMYKNVENAVDNASEDDDDTTYDAGSGVSLSDTTFSTNPGNNGVWNTAGSDWYYNGGKVGVGTNNPSSKLSVEGTLTAKAAGDDDSILIGNGENNLNSQNESGDRNSVVIGGKNTVQNSGQIPHASVQIGRASQTESAGNNYFQTVIGFGAKVNVGQPKNVVVGSQAYSSTSDSVVVGYDAGVENGRGMAIGSGSSASGTRAQAVGYGASVDANNSAAWGAETDVNEDNVYAYGYDADSSNGGPTQHGFGTVSPQYRLSVNDPNAFDVASFTDKNANTCVVDPTNSNGFSCSSDKRLKTDIQEISEASALKNLLTLNPSTYRWKANPNGSTQYGFLAQNVESVFPEFVSSGPDGYKALSTNSLIPINIAATQQLADRVKRLEKEVPTVADDYWKDAEATGSANASENTADNFVDRVASAIGGVVENGVATFENLSADSITTKDMTAESGEFERVKAQEKICLDGECLSKEAFKQVVDEFGDTDTPEPEAEETGNASTSPTQTKASSSSATGDKDTPNKAATTTGKAGSSTTTPATTTPATTTNATTSTTTTAE